MTYPGFSTFKVGGVQFPLVADGYDLIVQADPAIYHILQYFKYCINYYLVDKWFEQVTKISLYGADGSIIGDPVAQLIPYSPGDYLSEVQYKFPFLSADRVRGKCVGKTREWYEELTDIELVYAMPPMTAEQMYQMNSFRHLIVKIIQDRISNGWDPGYRSGETIFRTAGIEEIALEDFKFVGIENPVDTNTFFPTIFMVLKIKERRNYVTDSFPPLTEIDGYISSNTYDLIDFQLNLP